MNAPIHISPRPLAHEDGDLVHLLSESVRIVPGFNPRTYFDEAEHRELVESVRAQGIVTPVAVRPDPSQEGRYLLIAGERRVRAARAVGLTSIPAIVRLVDEVQARAIALAEKAPPRRATCRRARRSPHGACSTR